MTTGRVAPTGAALPCYQISRGASRTIDTWAWGLADGSLTLQQLPDALVTLYNIAYEQGRASREQEVLDAKHDADRLWLKCFGEKERQEYLLHRLDRAAEIIADTGNIEHHLDEAFRLYVASLDSIRKPIALPVSTQDHMKEAAA